MLSLDLLTLRVVFRTVGGVVLHDVVVVFYRVFETSRLSATHPAPHALRLAVAVMEEFLAAWAAATADTVRPVGVVLAKQLVVPESKLVPGHELLLARDTAEAVKVEDLALGTHHIVVLPKGLVALVALGAIQPGKTVRDVQSGRITRVCVSLESISLWAKLLIM